MDPTDSRGCSAIGARSNTWNERGKRERRQSENREEKVKEREKEVT